MGGWWLVQVGMGLLRCLRDNEWCYRACVTKEICVCVDMGAHWVTQQQQAGRAFRVEHCTASWMALEIVFRPWSFFQPLILLIARNAALLTRYCFSCSTLPLFWPLPSLASHRLHNISEQPLLEQYMLRSPSTAAMVLVHWTTIERQPVVTGIGLVSRSLRRSEGLFLE